MGNCMNKNSAKQHINLAILGLDNAGKTVTAKGLTGESPDGVAPTMGFTSVDFTLDKYDVTMYDLGGGKRIRTIWKDYFAEIYGVIYVIDSSARDRVDECHSTFQNLLQHSQVMGKPLLILANKQDKSGALDEVDICDQLNLEELVNKFKTPCRVEPCSAILGQGKKLDKSIKQGLQWLLGMISREWEDLHTRVQSDIEVKQEKKAKEKKERVERVRKIKEERERKEREERQARGEAEPESEDESMMPDGDPFKRLNLKDVERKQQQLKEEKRRKKEFENNRKSTSDTNSRSVSRSMDQSLEDGDMSVPSHISRRPLPSLHSTDMQPSTTTSSHHSLGKLGQYDSPRPNRRFVKGVSHSMQSPPSNSEEDEEADHQGSRMRNTSSLTNAHWLREAKSEQSPTRSPGLSPFGHQSTELGSQQTRRVLAPLTPLEPLDSLDQRSKKTKKKKAKKNQTQPDAALTEDSPGWPAPRASRSPRLDTVQEPDNEGDSGQMSFSKKYNLLDDLPDIPRSRSLRPNYDDSLIT